MHSVWRLLSLHGAEAMFEEGGTGTGAGTAQRRRGGGGGLGSAFTSPADSRCPYAKQGTRVVVVLRRRRRQSVKARQGRQGREVLSKSRAFGVGGTVRVGVVVVTGNISQTPPGCRSGRAWMLVFIMSSLLGIFSDFFILFPALPSQAGYAQEPGSWGWRRAMQADTCKYVYVLVCTKYVCTVEVQAGLGAWGLGGQAGQGRAGQSRTGRGCAADESGPKRAAVVAAGIGGGGDEGTRRGILDWRVTFPA